MSVKIRLQPCLVPAMSIWSVAVASQVPCDVLHNFSCSKLFSAMTKVKVGGSKYSVCVSTLRRGREHCIESKVQLAGKYFLTQAELRKNHPFKIRKFVQ